MTKLGTSFASTGLSANFWTGIALALSIGAGISYALSFLALDITWYHAAVIGGVLLLISGFFDVVDGNVARFTRQTSKKGAFFDSSFDKIYEVMILGVIAFVNLTYAFWCL